MFVSRTLLLALLLGAAPAADAAIFTVTNTNTSGAGSLHQAILDANVEATADSIQFAIAGGGLKVIAGNLPAITQPVTIDGYTQPSTSVNTLAGSATDATLRIVLEGSALAVGENVLDVEKEETTIRGLVINKVKAKGSAIAVGADAENVFITGCFIGTDAAGNADDTAGIGITVSGTAVIGSPSLSHRNLISGNDGSGIVLRGPGSVVQNNLIGTDAGGTTEVPNGVGIQVTTAGASGNRIGGTGKGAGNQIAGNTNEGILLTSTAGSGNRFEQNRIHSNGELGIDLGNDGVTPNDDDDSDTGPNGAQNFPEIAHARFNGSTLHVEGVLFGAPGQYRVELFESEEPDESGHGEGAVFRDFLLVTIPDGEEAAAFVNDSFLNAVATESVFLTATATRTTPTQQSTSEFSRAVEVLLGGEEIVVTNTNDSGAGSLRAALAAAQADAEPDTIVFDIPGDGPHTIVTASALGVDVSPVIVDGYSQPGSRINTAPSGTNADLRISVDGSTSTAATFSILGPTASVRGLNFHSGAARGVRLVDTVGAQIEGCFVGTDVTGTIDLGNANDGISTGTSQGTVIGGYSRANRNLLSGNDFRGIVDTGPGSRILNNLIGTDASGTQDLGNGADGIHASGSEAAIGSDEADLVNLIRGNGRNGIDVAPDSQAVAILGNDVSGNEDLGIDLNQLVGNTGVTLNDVDDADGAGDGGNALQNFPVVIGVVPEPGKSTVTGSLDVPVARLDSVYRLRFFASSECDPSGHGEGEVFLAAVDVLIPEDEEFTVQIPVELEEGEFLTMTAQDPSLGDTSEFSGCFEVGGGGEPDPLCGDASLNETIAAGDALFVLQTAVGSRTCDLCVCDVNDNGAVQSSDALSVLRKAVGQPLVLDCPACD